MIDKNLLEFNKAEIQQIEENQKQREANLHKFATKDISAVYNNYENKNLTYRTNFGTDIDRILYNPFYNRFSDKTQVHSFLKNDDITRRALHMQLVSKISRSIGSVLNLNLELIEAISIGHDIGHTPFGHKGEDMLNKISLSFTNRHFNHNVHSVRVLEKITNNRISLQTLDGIVSHNGIFQNKIVPSDLKDYNLFDKKIESCYLEKDYCKTNVANTLEGCLVRVCDKLAYIGKDIQDLYKVGLGVKYYSIKDYGLGKDNPAFLKNTAQNLIKNSLNKNYIALDDCVIEAIKNMQKQNNEMIYQDKAVIEKYDNLENLFKEIFNLANEDLNEKTDCTFIFRNFLNAPYLKNYREKFQNHNYECADVVIDYIASMTDDYFIELADKLNLFKKYNVPKIEYTGYFEE